jgi:hypothetical protein
MPKTNADYQREHRQRRARCLAQLEAENAELRADLAGALVELERLSATQCKHPPRRRRRPLPRLRHRDLVTAA